MHLNAFSPVWVLSKLKFLQLRVLLCLFKPPDSEKLLPHFLHLNCLSPVWFLPVSSIHQILISSCQTMRTHNFSTVGGVLLYLWVIWWREAIVTFGALECLLDSWFHSRGGIAESYDKVWSLPSLILTGSLMWRGCAKCTTAKCCAAHTENRLQHGIEPENGKSGRAMFWV